VIRFIKSKRKNLPLSRLVKKEKHITGIDEKMKVLEKEDDKFVDKQPLKKNTREQSIDSFDSEDLSDGDYDNEDSPSKKQSGEDADDKIFKKTRKRKLVRERGTQPTRWD